MSSVAYSWWDRLGMSYGIGNPRTVPRQSRDVCIPSQGYMSQDSPGTSHIAMQLVVESGGSFLGRPMTVQGCMHTLSVLGRPTYAVTVNPV